MEEAVLFAKWLANSYWIYSRAHKAWDNKQSYTWTSKTTEELYQIFKNEPAIPQNEKVRRNPDGNLH